jgi:hypothetical protein
MAGTEVGAKSLQFREESMLDRKFTRPDDGHKHSAVIQLGLYRPRLRATRSAN